ncbi:MAG TPA: HEXXH motif domain-containing protein [Micromonosporaceae bacterium]|nr:HEXXH motif domain-containing protein [Micromonosporaceae bacterium]
MPELRYQQTGPLTNHALPLEHFDALASGAGEPATVRLLLAGEYSRRLLLLRALLDRAAERPALLGALPPAEAVWNTLIDVHARAPDVLHRVLLHPQVGTWISHALRRSRWGAENAGPDQTDVGQIHAVALAAAIRAGLSIRTRVPVRCGGVLLPTLGLARFPSVTGYETANADSADGLCRLRVQDHEVVVPADPGMDAPGWWSLRSLRCRSGGRVLTVSFDDIDPYRNLADPVEPCRLDDRTVDAWRRVLDAAWEVLARWHPATADAMAAGLMSIAPLAGDASWTVQSASTGDGFGGALISLPPDPVTLAVTLVHEFQHVKLGGLLHLTTLYHEDAREDLYAPWRPDPRPLAGLVQGTYAFFGITDFWRTQRHEGTERDRRIADFEFAYSRRQTWTGLRTLMRSRLLTDLGERLVHRLTARLRPWLAEPVHNDSARAAWAAAVDHRAGWRIRNLPVDLEWVGEAVEAWRHRHDPPPIGSTEPAVGNNGSIWAHSRLTLYRSWLATRNGHGGACLQLPDAAAVPGVTCADLAMLVGEPAQATRGYLGRITGDCADLDAWTGLGLALAAAGGTPAWRPLLRTPELVHALYRELADDPAPPSPLDLALWLGCRPPGRRSPDLL